MEYVNNNQQNMNEGGEKMEQQNNYSEQPKQEQPKKKPELKKIEFRAAEMKGVSKTAFSTTNIIGQSITQVLQNVSDDVVACVVYTKPRNGIMANLVLTNNRQAHGKSKFVLPYNQISPANGQGLFSVMRNSQNQKHWLNLTDDAKAKLEDFIPFSYMNGSSSVINFSPDKKVRWGQVTKEFTERSGAYGEARIYMAVQFDIGKWYKAIYGARNPETGSPYEYIVSPIRPEQNNVGMYFGQKSVNYIVSVTQCDVNELRRAYETTTGMSSNNIYPSFYAF